MTVICKTTGIKTERYTNDDESIGDDVRTNHPNRNTSKDDATNAGGYKDGVGSWASKK